MKRLLGALQFLTVIPLSGAGSSPGKSAVFFPLVGAVLGWCGAAIYLPGSDLLSPGLASLLVVGFWAAVTGALHEDGLADVADAFRAHRPPERILAILKDSRIGTYGALAACFSVLVRWQAIGALATGVLPAFVASQTVSRAAMVALAWVSRPAGGGMGADFCRELSSTAALIAVAQAVAAALWCGRRAGVLILAATAVIVILARGYFHRRIGGVTGDCLGATAQVTECATLLVLACRDCIL